MAGSKKCIICGKPKRVTEAIKHKNETINESFVICKECANSVDFNDENSVIAMCQLANLPFIKKLIIKLMTENDSPTFGNYMQRLAPYKKYEVFADSDFTDGEESEIQSQGKVSDKMKARWGDDHPTEKYASFENSLRNLMAIKPAATAFELKRYVQNVKLESVLNEALYGGDYKAIYQLRKSYNDDLKELGFDTVLNAKEDTIDNLGQRIQKWEETKPIPDRKEYEDVSSISKYFQKYFLTPLRRNFNMATEEELEELNRNEPIQLEVADDKKDVTENEEE